MKKYWSKLPAIAGVAGALLAAPPALAYNSWSSWWLPDNYSVHGRDVDRLFNWIFWITMVTLVLVQVTMLVFLIRYRRRPGVKKGIFIHGHTRLEMIWTLVPALILAAIALPSKQVWTDYKYGYESRGADVKPANVMVIGEQFKWNIVYPGPDGKFGRYLLYPKATDARWPEGKKFQGYAGPRDVPREKMASIINAYIISSDANKLGKDMDDPSGKDDIWQGSLGKVLEVPVDRPTDVYVASKDVIHSFSLPNFRVKLDTLPGMLNIVSFQPNGVDALSAEREKFSRTPYTLEQVAELLKDPATREQRIYISEADAAMYNQGNNVRVDKDKLGWRFVQSEGAKKTTIIRDAAVISFDTSTGSSPVLDKLKAIGVDKITAYRPGYFDIVCMELCGQGHYTMQGQMNVIDGEAYAQKYEGKKPATQPVAVAK